MTSYRPIAKGETVTSWTTRSSLVPSALPMRKLPPGITTRSGSASWRGVAAVALRERDLALVEGDVLEEAQHVVREHQPRRVRDRSGRFGGAHRRGHDQQGEDGGGGLPWCVATSAHGGSVRAHRNGRGYACNVFSFTCDLRIPKRF